MEARFSVCGCCCWDVVVEVKCGVREKRMRIGRGFYRCFES
jgi:hypothetical protein